MSTMRLGLVLTLGLTAAVGLTALPAGAQDEMMRTLEPFVVSAVELTDGVRLDEARLTTILQNIESLNELGTDEDDDLTERAFRDGRYDFGVIVKDPEYVAWCKGRGLDPLDFFKGLMRLETLVMRESFGENAEQMRAQVPAQRKQIEDMRGMLGDEATREALADFDANMADFERAAKVMERIPVPTAREASLLATYHDQIAAAMGDVGDEDEIDDSDD